MGPDRAAGAAGLDRPQQIGGGLPGHHAAGHRVGVALVAVAALAHAAGYAHPTALLDHVRGFVGRDPQAVRARAERDLLTRGVGGRPDRLVGGVGCAAFVGLDIREVVAPEGRLDAITVRQRRAGSAHALGGRVPDGPGPAPSTGIVGLDGQEGVGEGIPQRVALGRLNTPGRLAAWLLCLLKGLGEVGLDETHGTSRGQCRHPGPRSSS